MISILIAVIFYIFGIIIARMMLKKLNIDKSEWDAQILSWICVLVLLIREK